MSNSSTPPALSSVATVEDDVTAASVTSHRAGAAGFDGGYSSVNWPALGFGLALAVAGITGNALVCIAVRVQRKLQNVTNYFLVSLAVTDLLVSLVVIPCCIIQEFVGSARAATEAGDREYVGCEATRPQLAGNLAANRRGSDVGADDDENYVQSSDTENVVVVEVRGKAYIDE